MFCVAEFSTVHTAGLIWASLPCLEQLGEKTSWSLVEEIIKSMEGIKHSTEINFQHRYLSQPYSEVISLSKNGRNQSWCKCMVISRYDFVTKVTHDAQVQLREMFQMTKRSYFVVWPYPPIDIKRKQWTELVPRSPKGGSRFFQRTVLNILGCSHQQVKVL